MSENRMGYDGIGGLPDQALTGNPNADGDSNTAHALPSSEPIAYTPPPNSPIPDLSTAHWTDPLERLLKAANREGRHAVISIEDNNGQERFFTTYCFEQNGERIVYVTEINPQYEIKKTDLPDIWINGAFGGYFDKNNRHAIIATEKTDGIHFGITIPDEGGRPDITDLTTIYTLEGDTSTTAQSLNTLFTTAHKINRQGQVSLPPPSGGLINQPGSAVQVQQGTVSRHVWDSINHNPYLGYGTANPPFRQIHERLKTSTYNPLQFNTPAES